VAIFEALYIVYRIVPYTKKIQRSLLKEPKLYFYDTGLVKGDAGAVFENMVANALQKHIHGIRDAKGLAGSVMYLKNKEQKEVDFALVNDGGELEKLVEVKVSDDAVSKNLLYFAERHLVPAVQVVRHARHSRKVTEHVEVRVADEFLKSLYM
jgi:predicted AAA+ superfamily ATPase